MRAWAVHTPGPVATGPLRLVERAVPEPGSGELLLRVLACGICRLFAPAGDLVPTALEQLDRGGVLAIAGIHLTDVPVLNYQRHLFQEREIRSVTANTRADGEEFLRLAGRQGLAVTTMPYDLADADRALTDLATGEVRGAAVLVP